MSVLGCPCWQVPRATPFFLFIFLGALPEPFLEHGTRTTIVITRTRSRDASAECARCDVRCRSAGQLSRNIVRTQLVRYIMCVS